MKATTEIGDQSVEIDFSEAEERIKQDMNQKLVPMFEKYMKEYKDYTKKPEGKGVVETYLSEDKKASLIEEFKKGGNCNEQLIQEQWTIVLPKDRVNEPAAHMRDFVYVTDAVKGKVGDVVEIPVVKDLEFEHLVAGTGAITPTTGLITTLTTTLHESGASYDAYYTDIEKINQNLLDELNSVMAHAAVRAEDFDLLNLMEAGTTSQFGETGYGSDGVIKIGDYGVNGGVVGSTFNVAWVADAIGRMIAKGKDVHPGELVLYLNPVVYAHFLKKVTASTSTAYAFARSDVQQSGMVEEWLGVRVLTGGTICRSVGASGIGGGNTSYQVAFLFRPKRALALAPKRDILIETDKIIASRTLRIVATHTYGVAAVDLTEAQPIFIGVS